MKDLEDLEVLEVLDRRRAEAMTDVLKEKRKSDNKFYLTTPIYYPSDKLHIGHSYTTVAADCIARYQRSLGKDVMFLTGMDEHGQKIQETAEAAGLEPQEYVDNMAVGIKDLWKLMNISYDKFIRTTDDYHEKAVQEVFKKLYDQGDIYKGKYQGWYCTSCESFWTESQLAEGGVCPDCSGPVYLTKEESYFFKLSKYGDKVLELYKNQPDFLKPDRSKNEMIHFIEEGLEDLAVTRTSFNWGIPVPFDPDHVIYVWVDALVNYISALGYPNDVDGNFGKYWPANIHLVGKEIVRFHCIIWPALLMALGIELPERVFAHGWLLLNDSKMSKSKGNIVDPVLLCERYGVDAIRYFLLREVSFGSDGNFSNEALVERINSDLANDLGNLLSRSTAMVNKYFDGVLPNERVETEFDKDLAAVANKAITDSRNYLDQMQFSHALEAIWDLVKRSNKYIDETTPWILAKSEDESAKLANVLGNLLEALRITGILLAPFMPDTSDAILASLGKESDINIDLEFSEFVTESKVETTKPLFPRLELDKEMEWLDKINSEQKEKAKARQEKLAKVRNKNADVEAKTKTKAEIKFNDFEKLELLVATVKDCQAVPETDRLLQFKLETSNGEIRDVISGLAEHYKPEDLIGKQVVLLANLEPRKIKGVVSQGMILSAENKDGSLSLLTTDKEVESGAEIG